MEHSIPDSIKPRVREKLKTISPDEPLQRLGLISNRNLEFILEKTQTAIKKAVEMHGAEAVCGIIKEAEELCQLRNIALTHDPHWDMSAYSDDDPENGSLTSILKDKALKAPSITQGDAGYTFVSCGIIPAKAAIKLTQEPYFRIDSPPADLFSRSMGCITINAESIPGMNVENIPATTIIGGNHLQVAWLLATINNSLRAWKSGEAKVAYHSEQAFGELKIPNELSLVGQRLIQNNEVEAIKPPRTTPKAIHRKKRNIDSSDPDNPDLKNKSGRNKDK